MDNKLNQISNGVKTYRKEIILAVIVFLLCLLSFGAGILTYHYLLKPPLTIEAPQSR